MLHPVPLANYLGFLALVSYFITLLPTILRVVFPSTKKTGIPQIMLKYRRIIGLISFGFALLHGILLVQKRNIDFFDLETYSIYLSGVSTFSIFIILAITSNDWSVRRLKTNWPRLHKLTYLAMFLLVWHVYAQMSGRWSYVTSWGFAISILVIGLFAVRKYVEFNKVKKIRYFRKNTANNKDIIN